jgi:hypothetical protein
MDLGSWLELAEIHLSKSDFAVGCRKLLLQWSLICYMTAVGRVLLRRNVAHGPYERCRTLFAR